MQSEHAQPPGHAVQYYRIKDLLRTVAAIVAPGRSSFPVGTA